jgi:hypothetical protein
MALGCGHGLMHLNNHFLFICPTTGTNRNMRLQQNYLRPTPEEVLNSVEARNQHHLSSFTKKSLSSKNHSAKRIFCPGYIV